MNLQKPSIYGETPESLANHPVLAREPSYRVRQITDWLYKKHVSEWSEMVNIPNTFRQKLEANFVLSPSTVVLTKKASDVTEKILLREADNQHIETVIIKAPQIGVGVASSRKTVCLSTQVGCAYGCRFCASGLDGWKRNLTTAEIVDQLFRVSRHEMQKEQGEKGAGLRCDNIVFMGMGEPLANYDNLMAAIHTINADWGFRFGARRITISTAGLVPQIQRLSEEKIQFRLALSLHGATNDVRDQIMPINKRYPLEVLIPAVEEFSQKHGRMMTLEYILIKDVNDSLNQAQHLTRIAKKLHAHVNLIPYNHVVGLPWERPDEETQSEFYGVIRDKSVSVTIRREKGHEIDAACGQLRLRTEKESLD